MSDMLKDELEGKIDKPKMNEILQRAIDLVGEDKIILVEKG
jgi:hypothetical protein